MADLERLIRAHHRRVAGDHSRGMIEPDLDLIAEADVVIDLASALGLEGGKVACAGPPTLVAQARG